MYSAKEIAVIQKGYDETINEYQSLATSISVLGQSIPTARRHPIPIWAAIGQNQRRLSARRCLLSVYVAAHTGRAILRAQRGDGTYCDRRTYLLVGEPGGHAAGYCRVRMGRIQCPLTEGTCWERGWQHTVDRARSRVRLSWTIPAGRQEDDESVAARRSDRKAMVGQILSWTSFLT